MGPREAGARHTALFALAAALAGPDEDAAATARALLSLAALGDRPRALRRYRQALLLAERGGDLALQARALRGLGQAAEAGHDLAQAQALYLEALRRARQAGELIEEGRCLLSLGRQALRLAEDATREDRYHPGLRTLPPPLPADELRAESRCRLAQALELLQSAGPQDVGPVLSALADLALAEGRWADAAALIASAWPRLMTQSG